MGSLPCCQAQSTHILEVPGLCCLKQVLEREISSIERSSLYETKSHLPDPHRILINFYRKEVFSLNRKQVNCSFYVFFFFLPQRNPVVTDTQIHFMEH